MNNDVNGQIFELGDSHNFGLQTKCYPELGYAYKPRTVFWEELFFGKEGLIPHVFDNPLVVKSLTQYEVLEQDEIGAKVKLLITEKKLNLTFQDMLECYAAMGIVATTFGLIDLHLANIVITGYGPCPIDVELVFMPIQYLSSTLVVPTRVMASGWAAIAPLLPTMAKASPENLTKLLQSVEDGFLKMLDQQQNIEKFFQEKDAAIQNTPIRLLLRQSADYMKFLQGNKEILRNPIPEELEQLGRGDIPYFFSYLSREGIYYYNEPNKEKKITSNLTQAGSVLHPPKYMTPKELIKPNRIKDWLLAVTMVEFAELFSKLNPSLKQHTYKTKHSLISYSDDGVEIDSDFTRGVLVNDLVDKDGKPLKDRRFDEADDKNDIPSMLDARSSHRVPNLFFKFS